MMKKIVVLFSAMLFSYMVLRADVMPGDTINVAYKLHGQTRRFKFVYDLERDGGITLHWSIMRNLRLWKGSYSMSPESVERGSRQSYLMPEDGNHITLKGGETFGMISADSFNELCEKGKFIYNGVEYVKTGEGVSDLGNFIEVVDEEEGARMQILDNGKLPLIVRMSDNPLEIDWTMTK